MASKLLRTAALFCLFFNFLSSIKVSAQDKTYARQLMDTLASPAMFGRGYVNNGSGIAADFLAAEMKKLGLQSFDGGYKQDFKVNVLTYPTIVSLNIDGKQLKPGSEFTVFTGSPSIKGTYKLITIDSSWFKTSGKLKKLSGKDLKKTLICYNPAEMKGRYRRMADSLLRNNFINCGGFIHLTNNSSISWSVMSRGGVIAYPILTVLKSAIPEQAVEATLELVLKPKNNYTISNVIGYIPGTTQPDSFFVLTAHYDHLGMLGKDTYFPGANDNASGTAMILDLARHYMQETNRLPFSVVFMAFAGEEIGLKGSNYYVDNPSFSLQKIKFLINLDMVGTGSEGITMVNGEQLPVYFDKMVKINADNEYILKVAKRGESCNSDHCPFYKEGVPAVFIYSMGKEHTEYHNPDDRAEKVPLSEYEDIFRLLRDYIDTL